MRDTRIRDGAFAVVGVLLSAAAHAVAAGARPAPAPLLLVGAIAWLAAGVLRVRRRPVGVEIVAMLGLQVGGHLALANHHHGPLVPGAGMLGAHVVAAALLVCWLRRVDRDVAAWLGLLLAPALAPLRACPVPVVAPWRPHPAPAPLLPLHRAPSLGRRGPPLAA